MNEETKEAKAGQGETGWGAPPDKKGEIGRLRSWLDEVKSKPGEWAWRTYSNTGSGSVVGAKLRKLGFETQWAGKELRLYVRWPKPAIVSAA